MRLTAKITVLIVVVLIIGFGASTIFTIKRESDLLVEQSKESARRLVATVVASIETAMLQERPDITRGLIQDLKSSSPVEGLTIYRRNGVEAFTDLATLREVSKEAELPKDVVTSIEKMRREPGRTMTGPLFQRAVETLRTQEALETRDGVSLFVLNQPIANQERCQGCHGTDHKVRAVVRVATSMEPVLAQVALQRNRQIMIAILTIVTAAAVLAVAMRFVVVRPIHELARVARRIGEGDFEARAPASGDEVGELGTALNDMTVRLSQAQQELGARNTELATALENLQASRQRLELLEQLKGELSKFVPDAVKELLERDPSATTLEKRNEEVSVLFLDIAGYTRLSEQLEAKRLNQLVQTYFGSFLEIIRAHHGDVNETAGDGLMVIFQRTNRGGAGPARRGSRAQCHARGLRHPGPDPRAERGVRGHLPRDPAPHGHQYGRGAARGDEARRRGIAALDLHGHGTDHQPGRALRRLRGGRRHRGGTGDGRAHQDAVRPRGAGGEELQERLTAARRLSRHPARDLQRREDLSAA